MQGTAERLRDRLDRLLDALDERDEDAALDLARSWRSEWEEAWWKRDPGAVTGMADDHELHNRSRFTDWSEVYRGREGMWRVLDDIEMNTQRSRFEVEEVRRAGDRIATLGTLNVVARHTGLEFDFPWAFVFTIRDRAITRTDMFTDHAAARAALDNPSDASERL